MKNTKYKQLLEQIEGKPYISDIFHKKTNNKTLKVGDDPKEWPESWKKIYFKTYPRFEKISLDPIISDELNSILKNRRSVRKYSDKPLAYDELSYILYSSCGLINFNGDFNNTRRPYPSAGGRYPLEIYFICLNVDSLKKGLYHYNVRDNVIELLLEKNLLDWVLDTFGGQTWISKGSAIFIITSVIDRSRIKYRDRSYRFSLIEAGHLGQNICILAEKLKLGTCALGGYMEYEVDKLLDIQNTKEITLYSIVVGNK